jgi:uncharacterized protein DUF3489
MATKQPRKPAKSAAKADADAANKPAHHRQRAPRPRTPQVRSKPAAPQTSSAAGPATAASNGASDRMEQSTNTPPLPERLVSRSAPPSQSGDLTTANVSSAKRPRASSRRAQLIDILERPEGASVAEIGQRLGWLPHTVRAAFTGLRHAGCKVMRSKDATGRSVYRLARVETAPER